MFLMERAKRIDFEFFIALDASGEEVLTSRPRQATAGTACPSMYGSTGARR